MHNNLKHTSKPTKEWLQEKINVLNGPDIKPIENLWNYLKRAVHWSILLQFDSSGPFFFLLSQV